MKKSENKLGVLTGLSHEDLEKLSKWFKNLSETLAVSEEDVAKGFLNWIKKGKSTTP